MDSRLCGNDRSGFEVIDLIEKAILNCFDRQTQILKKS